MNELKELEEKIYNGKNLTEEELSDAVFELEVVDEVEGECGRWSQSMKTIVQVKDKIFAIIWERALTELQEHFFCLQPYEVVKKTRIIEETYYEKV